MSMSDRYWWEYLLPKVIVFCCSNFFWFIHSFQFQAFSLHNFVLKIELFCENRFPLYPPGNSAVASLCPQLLCFLQLWILYYHCLQSAFFLSVFTRLNQPVWFHSKTSILEIMRSMLLFFADISFTAHLNTDIGGEFFLMFSKEGCQLFWSFFWHPTQSCILLYCRTLRKVFFLCSFVPVFLKIL